MIKTLMGFLALLFLCAAIYLRAHHNTDAAWYLGLALIYWTQQHQCGHAKDSE